MTDQGSAYGLKVNLSRWFKQTPSLGKLLLALLIGAIVLFILVIVAVAILSKGHGILVALGNVDVARGLITFLVAFFTVISAFALVLAAIFVGKDKLPNLATGKEILAILIGVLGTIVGFYYGTSVQGGTQPLQVTPAVITNPTPIAGQTTTIVAFVTGGKPPYVYSITFTPSDIGIQDIKDVASQDGSINQAVQIPPEIGKNTDVTFQITVKDSGGQSTTYEDQSRTIFVKTQ